MATGLSNKLVGQTGEFLVASELSRRGLIATTFTGNVPHYDIIASDARGRNVAVQVKTIRSSSWQFADASHFFEVRQHGKRQNVGRARRCPIRGLVCVLVQLRDYGSDRFFVCTWEELRSSLRSEYKRYLERHRGVRPKNYRTRHIAISPKKLEAFENRWGVIERRLV